ncbi:hypothetical protein MRX96_053900 [Rhipicephalus microplus]
MVWIAAQDRTGPGATRRSATGDHRRGHVVIPPTLIRTARLPSPMETKVRCFRGQYSHFILTVPETTAEPVQKHYMIPSKLPIPLRHRVGSGMGRVAGDTLSLKALRTTATAPGSPGGIMACL